jgi:hypothetical protein
MGLMDDKVSWTDPLRKVEFRRIRYSIEEYKREELPCRWVDVLFTFLDPPRGLRTRRGYIEAKAVESES